MSKPAFKLGLAVATAVLILAFLAYRIDRGERESLAALRARIAEVEARTLPPSNARPTTDVPPRVAELLEQLTARIANLESSSRRREPSPATNGDAPTERAPAAPLEPSSETESDAERRELEAIVARMAAPDWDFTGEDAQRFFELARSSDALDALIDDLERRVDANPGDVDLRMALADSCVGKLMTMSGAEQGIWGGKAEEQWKAVVALDDEHWRAHSSLGTNYSFYPDVLGKTPDAIRHLERTRDIQRHADPEPAHVQTYLYLARMYLRDGRRDEAFATIEEGLGRHPDADELMAAYDDYADR